MGLKDQEIRRYNEDIYRRADLFNGTIFQGEQIIKAEYLKDAPRKKTVLLTDDGKPLQQIKYSKDEGIRYIERERDILSLHDDPQRKCYVACEGQSDADYEMPLRNLMYDSVEYSDQIRQKENNEKKESGLTRPLIPVFHLTLYTGENKWISKHNIQEMMDISEEMEKFRDLLPNYRTYVVDIHEQNPELFRTEWKDVFRLMGYSRKKEELREYIKTHIDEIRKLSRDTRMFMAILLDQYEIIEEKVVEVKDVCEAWDGAVKLEAEERAKEIAEEIAEERVEKCQKRFGQLISRLMEEKKYHDVEQVSVDKVYRQKLLNAYQL